ncbi:HPr family phosphocarrier protein [Alteribacter natronophilus]|uniref:HPr family phosphocarrier protein n=1 Tax=Alteribacter natronophilus TaxID=2583810 RepID=UPI00110F0984|nr:HPr family phosphocarrier protein [Alteribacter natronophilus]TMW73933.1 HPr family phosphocarrier protein [Alteribacter natronophilus]
MKLVVNKPIFAETASTFVNTASKYPSTIMIKKEHWVVDAKSLLGVLALSLQPGQEIEFTFDGETETGFIDDLLETGKFSRAE